MTVLFFYGSNGFWGVPHFSSGGDMSHFGAGWDFLGVTQISMGDASRPFGAG